MPAKINLTAYRGDLFEQTFTLQEKDDQGVTTPIDFTGKRIRMQIRANRADRVSAALADLGNDETREGITADDEGNIFISAVLDLPAACYFYDIEVSDAGDDPVTHITGKIKFQDDSTFE